MTKNLYIAVFVFVLLLTGILLFLLRKDMGMVKTCSENLCLAIEANDSTKIEALLSGESCSVTAITLTGYSALTLAASKNDLAILEILLRDLEKADLLQRDSFSRNPIDYAIRGFDPEVLRLYLDIFPGILSWEDEDEVLYEKILRNSPRIDFEGPMKDILMLLEENDPKEHFYNKGRDIILDKASGIDIRIRTQWIDFFLFEAWKKGATNETLSLIERGADPFAPYEGKSLYDRTILKKNPLLFATLVDQTHADLERKDKDGVTLLEKSINAGFLPGVKTLIEKKVNIQKPNSSGSFPLTQAIGKSFLTNDFTVVDYLMAHKPSVKSINQARGKLWELSNGKQWIPKKLLISFYGKDYWKGSKEITRGFESLLTGISAKSLVICDDVGCDPGQLKKISLHKSGISMVYQMEGKEYTFQFQPLGEEDMRFGGFEYKSGQSVRLRKLTGMALLDVPNSTVGTIFEKEGKDYLKLVTINITGKGATTICMPLTKASLPGVMDKVHKMKLWQLLMEYYAFKEG
ncbi:ankyrin repeat domain-containing protein [bacterium]|nr:ankyrin repeat domain-containing protein [bacterium]